MKKTLFCMSVFLSTHNLFAQIEKGNILFSGYGNYFKATTENGATTNLNMTNEKSLHTGVSIGYFFSDKFIGGAGLDFINKKETRINYLELNKFMQMETMHIKSQGFLPYVFVGYYLPVIPELYFNTYLKLSHGQIKLDYETMYAGQEIPQENSLLSPNTTYSKGRFRNEETGYFETQIAPELSYFFSKKFSIYLGLGGISYSMFDGKTANSNWLISFNPSFWTMGIKFQL